MPSAYDTLASLLTTTLGRPAASITPETVLDDLSLDSLALVELSVALTEHLGVRVNGVQRGQTLAELGSTLDAALTAALDTDNTQPLPRR
jgi:acyl carrier protein